MIMAPPERPKRRVKAPANYAEGDASDEEDSELGRRAAARAARERERERERDLAPGPIDVELTKYERDRLENIRRNEEQLAALGLDRAKRASSGRSGGGIEHTRERGGNAGGDGGSSSSSSSESDGRQAKAARALHDWPSRAPATPAQGKKPARAPRSAGARTAASAGARPASSKGAAKAKAKAKVKDEAADVCAAGTSDAPIDLEVHGAQARHAFELLAPAGEGLVTVATVLRAARSVQMEQIDARRAQQMVDVLDRASKGGLDVDDLMALVARPEMRSVLV
ncbi:hypothetical protein KFE25_002954 [Diacronema lutheri]|uniref:Uncharacterized protein n=1 Tax=Diacronema lutheri TaxID=2081491 RepID=A0A8J5XP88_DIALT|nr:hypothetical protein KFE25_002954 [Diacronema lutheri]